MQISHYNIKEHCTNIVTHKTKLEMWANAQMWWSPCQT